MKKFYEDNKFIPIDLGMDLGNNAKDREFLADKIVEVIIAKTMIDPYNRRHLSFLFIDSDLL